MGTPVYLEAEVNIAIPATNIVSVTWALTNIPMLSALTNPATAFTASPLGTNVPVYDPSDRTLYQVAPVNGRTLLRPDVVGQYTVVATIVSASYGTTNVTQTITAGTYMGLNTCGLCHSGGSYAPRHGSILADHRSRDDLFQRHQRLSGQPLQRVLPPVPHRRL